MRKQRSRRRQRQTPSFDLTRIRLTEEEIRADLLYPAPVRTERRR